MEDTDLKIFGVGLSKTGTNSLTAALRELGYDAVHWKVTKTMFEYAPGGSFEFDYDRIADHDAFTDLPIARAFRELDARFPNAKFVLTSRDEEAWLRSARKHFHELVSPEALKRKVVEPSKADLLARDVYGAYLWDRDTFAAGRRRHEQSVRDYFAERPDDLLEITTGAETAYGDLCDFLGHPRVDKAFPHEFKSAKRRVAGSKLTLADRVRRRLGL